MPAHLCANLARIFTIEPLVIEHFVHASRGERFESVRYQLATRRTMATDWRANGVVTKFECTNMRYANDLDPEIVRARFELFLLNKTPIRRFI